MGLSENKGISGSSLRSIRLDAIGDVAALPGCTARDDPNGILTHSEEYPIKTEPRMTDSNQEHRELAIEGNGAKIVVAIAAGRHLEQAGRPPNSVPPDLRRRR